MGIHLSASDRTFMRHFAIMIGVLAGTAVVLIIIGTFVFKSLPTYSREGEVQRAGDRITPVAGVYAGSSGQAALAAAAPAQPAASAADSAAADAAYAYDAAKAKTLYDNTCGSCHQATGEGVAGTFPPLKGNPAVADANPQTQVETILHGRQGTVIDGKKYAGIMPAFAAQLSNVEIADIANYERSSWGNHGKPLTAADVAKLRAGGGK